MQILSSQKRDAPHYVWKYFAVTDHAHAKKSTAKSEVHVSCDKMQQSRGIAHILGCPVLGQHKAGRHSCIVINKNDDEEYYLA